MKMQASNSNKYSFIIPPDLLDDIGSRFLLDAPDSELNDPIAICFLTELSYWFYLDEYVEEDDNLDTLKFDPFALQLFAHMNLRPKTGTVEDMLHDFREFKLRVPTYGALLLNEDLSNVLLVQGFWRRASWGFPKGKINVEEEPHKCAIREVLEETGYDISSQLNKTDFLETTIGEQKVRLYVIPGVSMSTEFVPKTKGEIKEFKWFPINQLPAHKHDRSCSLRSTNMFYMVMPFVKLIRNWIANRSRGGSHTKESRRRHKSLSSDHHKSRQQSPAKRDSPSDKCRGGPTGGEVSPKRSKQKYKGKKNNIVHSEISQDEHQKFSFKNRNKAKGNGNNRQQNADLNSGQKDPSKQFSSYSWQSFRLNKKAINEALDKAWRGVSL